MLLLHASFRLDAQKGLLHLETGIGMQPRQEQIAKESEHRCGETQDEQNGASHAPPSSQVTGMQVASVEKSSYQSSCFFGILAPVMTPGNVGP